LLTRYSADISTTFLKKFDEPYIFHDARYVMSGMPKCTSFVEVLGITLLTRSCRLEITQTEVPFNDLEKMGNIIEEILLHNVPMQYHPPTSSLISNAAAPSLKRKALGNVSLEANNASALNAADMQISKKRRVVDENDDSIMGDS
jgi:hypothetical protein